MSKINKSIDKFEVCIVGGFGHVGLPLSMSFASKGITTCAFDISEATYKIVSKGKMPFMEEGGEQLLEKTIKSGMLTLSTNPDNISESKNVIVVIGTPIDMHLNPESVVEEFFESYIKYIKDGQLIVLRSTVHPGTTEKIHRLLTSKGKKVDVAFCAERIIQGSSIKEITELPQIISSTTKKGEERAVALFSNISKEIIRLSPKEAELAKLFTNSWRYIKFAAANQFFIIANEAGVDFYKIYNAMTYNYPRAKDLPTAGFASGPCLFKDTAHLNSFSNSNFHMGASATQINEGLPAYIVSKIKKRYDLSKKNVGILGLAFKSDNDDKRDSLSYNLIKFLKFDAKHLYYSDPYVEQEGKIAAEKLIKESDIIILATPHKQYKNLKIGKDKIVIDIWNFYKSGAKI
jgi:UDP-N-acetyl-D-mannosaminuronic acid dehydrogenase